MNQPLFSFPKTLDNTIISTFDSCKRKFFYNHLMHLNKKDIEIHLHAGKCYAAALDTFRSNFYDDDSPNRHNHEKCLILGLKRLYSSWGYDEETDKAFAGTNKSIERIAHAYIKHFDRFGPLTDEVQPLMIHGKAATERSFSIPLELNHPDTGDPIVFHGRFDMLANYHGSVWVYDDKTCSQLGKTWTSQWDYRSQFTGYCYGAKTFDYDIIGAIIRGTCLRQASLEFAQSISRRKQWQLDEWWEDIHRIVHEMIQYYNMLGDLITNYIDLKPQIEYRKIFPMNGIFNEACTKYSGCEFKELCISQRPGRWLSNYKIRVWDPANPED